MANKLFLIGIDIYLKQKELKGSVKDISDFKAILLEKYDFNESDIYEILNENATNKNIQDAFRRYIIDLNENDNLIIFFSGHGDYDSATDIGYWIPNDAKNYTDYIPNQTLLTYVEKIKSKHIFIISDSCFSNNIFLNHGTKSINEYFEKKSRWALTSAYNEAKDSDGQSNTLFAEFIIEFLENTEEDFRVSELIEFVKKKFEINIFQKPQGAALQVQGHNGGEFIFKIKQSSDKRAFKGYAGFEKILHFYKKNSKFIEIQTHEDRSKKVGFHLFQEVDDVIKKSTYYLYLFEGTNQTQTFNFLKENHSFIFKEKNLVIFISSEKGQKNREVRKKNIQDRFKPINLFYIDDFIRNHCTPKIISEDDSKYLSISNFIIPILNIDSVSTDIQNFFKSWYERSEEPILIIKGSGGIGKTTLAQYLADSLIEEYHDHNVLFIDSVQIKDSLLRNSKNDKLTLYNFYEALFDITDNIQEKLSEELFRINIDAGNILLIIDGLDEVISKLPNFDVTEFINSIKITSSELGSGKVIITCRTYFWDKTNFSNDSFSVIELEPFNEKQAKEFFIKSFGIDSKKANKGLKLAKDFKYPGSDKENIYHPYVLDIIRSIIENESENIDISKTDFNSKFLKASIKNDYITMKVCEREKLRVGQISVDEQISFFIYLAVKKRGIIRLADFNLEMANALNKKIDEINIEAFKSHPFLKIFDSSISFRYDFLADLFKSLYMSSFFNYENCENTINESFIDILVESCWYGSALNIEIVNRIERWSDDDLLQVSDIISQLRASLSTKKEIKSKAIASLFNLCLTINARFLSPDTNSNTLLLKGLFENPKNRIDDLSIININTDQNIKFDFSDLLISNSLIDNYNNFWKCKFNLNTKFKHCTLLNLKANQGNTDISKSNFEDCTFDNSIEQSLKSIELKKLNQVEGLKVFLNDFFHLFYSNGRLGRQWEHKVIAPRFNGVNSINIDYNRLIRILKKNNFLVITEELSKNKFEIDDNKKEAVVKFIKDGNSSVSILKLIDELKE